MYELLKGLRIIECSSFVASPSAGLYLSQLGAEVIRIDHIGGGPDHKRWPISDGGDSFYWEGLNKGKQSVAIDMRSDEGRSLIHRLATAPGDNSGILLTNFPATGFLSHDALTAFRADQITVRVMGTAKGGPALDYTVNSAVGLPFMTGPEFLGDVPVNHVLPAWDLLVGAYTSFALMAALRHRGQRGEGQEVRIPLSDMAISTVANLGQIAEVLQHGQDRPRNGNDLYGAFGRDFMTSDKRRLIIVAITKRQWLALINTLGLGAKIAKIEQDRGVDFKKSESARFQHLDALNPLIIQAISQMSFDDLTRSLDEKGGCWGPYKTVLEAARDPELVTENSIFETIKNVSGLTYPVPGAPASFSAFERAPVRRARRLGEDSREVLTSLLGMADTEFDDLQSRNIVGV